MFFPNSWICFKFGLGECTGTVCGNRLLPRWHLFQALTSWFILVWGLPHKCWYVVGERRYREMESCPVGNRRWCTAGYAVDCEVKRRPVCRRRWCILDAWLAGRRSTAYCSSCCRCSCRAVWRWAAYGAETCGARSTWHRDRAVRPGVLLGDVVPGPRGIVAGQSGVVSSFLSWCCLFLLWALTEWRSSQAKPKF
jgi:hypothetical protein